MQKDRIYKHTPLSNASDVPALARWLTDNGRGIDAQGTQKAVAVAFRQTQRRATLAFGTPNEVVVLDLNGPLRDAFLGVIRSLIVDQPQVDLRCRDMYRDIVDLTKFFAKEYKLPLREVYANLAPACIGDLRSAGNIIGLPVRDKLKDVADDCYEVALYGPQYEHAIPGYYPKVSLPFARLQAEATLLGSEHGDVHWWVSYPDLWLRVFVHLAGDPTLLWVLDERRPLITTVAETLKVTPTQAHALLLWQAHDRDMPALMLRCPKIIDDLPEDLPRWAREMDLHYPTLCASTIQMRQAYWESRAAHTMYGRMLRPGHSSGEACAFRIFGTVEDIVAIAAVTFWQNRISREIMVTSIDGGLDAPLVRIKGEGPSAGRDMWKQVLEPIAALDNPMRVSLQPQVVFP